LWALYDEGFRYCSNDQLPMMSVGLDAERLLSLLNCCSHGIAWLACVVALLAYYRTVSAIAVM